MTGWAVVALIAIIVWGVVQTARARAGITSDQHGNETIGTRDDGRSAAELEAAKRELAELKERIKVLERIATDANSGDAREQARISAEIEALRDLPAAAPSLKKEQSE